MYQNAYLVIGLAGNKIDLLEEDTGYTREVTREDG